MSVYKLTAELDGKVSEVIIPASDDRQAMIEASFMVMTLASPMPKNEWALGLIRLVSPSGELLSEMAPK